MSLNDCRKCRYLDREAYHTVPETDPGWRHVCVKRPGMNNMKSFPFHNTKCPVWSTAGSTYIQSDSGGVPVRRHIPGSEPA